MHTMRHLINIFKLIACISLISIPARSEIIVNSISVLNSNCINIKARRANENEVASKPTDTSGNLDIFVLFDGNVPPPVKLPDSYGDSQMFMPKHPDCPYPIALFRGAGEVNGKFVYNADCYISWAPSNCNYGKGAWGVRITFNDSDSINKRKILEEYLCKDSGVNIDVRSSTSKSERYGNVSFNLLNTIGNRANIFTVKSTSRCGNDYHYNVNWNEKLGDLVIEKSKNWTVVAIVSFVVACIIMTVGILRRIMKKRKTSVDLVTAE